MLTEYKQAHERASDLRARAQEAERDRASHVQRAAAIEQKAAENAKELEEALAAALADAVSNVS